MAAGPITYHAQVEIQFRIVNPDQYMALTPKEQIAVGDQFLTQVFGGDDKMKTLMEEERWMDQRIVTPGDVPLTEARIRAAISNCLEGFNALIRAGKAQVMLGPDPVPRPSSLDSEDEEGVRYVWQNDKRLCIHDYSLHLEENYSDRCDGAAKSSVPGPVWKLRNRVRNGIVIEAIVMAQLSWELLPVQTLVSV